jgi:lysozyme family protein
MADWNIAYNWMMDNEDFSRACKQVPDAGPAGAGPCFAISGINSAAWPTQFAGIAAIAQDQRANAVQQFYEENIWNNWFAQIASDDVCKRLFDFAVNGSSHQAVQCLQQALNSLGGSGTPLKEDGGWGPMTLAALNAADPNALVTAFKTQRVAHYQAIAAAHPDKAQYLKAWTARAEK